MKDDRTVMMILYSLEIVAAKEWMTCRSVAGNGGINCFYTFSGLKTKKLKTADSEWSFRKGSVNGIVTRVDWIWYLVGIWHLTLEMGRSIIGMKRSNKQ